MRARSKEDHRIIIWILGVGMILRLILSPLRGFDSDIGCFQGWALHAAQGISKFYVTDMFVDYPPGYIYILYIIGKVANIFHMQQNLALFYIWIKVPAMIADIVTVYLIYYLAKEKWNNKKAVIIASTYIFNPAIIINSTIWGQVDAVFTLAIVCSLYLLSCQKERWACSVFVIAALIKPQAFIFTPIYIFIFIEKWMKQKDIQTLLKSALYGIITFIILIVPFTIHTGPLFIFERYKKTMESYPYASLNAFNLFALLGGNWKDQSNIIFLFSYQVWGMIFIVLTVALAAIYYFKTTEMHRIYYTGLLIICSVFMLASRMHERYLFPAIALLLIVYVYSEDKKYQWLYFVFSTMQFTNVAYVLWAYHRKQLWLPSSDNIVRIVSAVSVLAFIYIVYDAIVPIWKQQKVAHSDIPIVIDKKTDMNPTDQRLLAILVIIYTVIAFSNIGDMIAPQKFWEVKDISQPAILDIGASQYVSHIKHYCGVEVGAYDISISTDGANWESAGTMNQGSVFKWEIFNIRKEAQYIMIQGTDKRAQLGEIALYNEKNEFLPIKAVENGQGLIDEPYTVPKQISYKNSTYFDEVYHARTAYEHIHHIVPYEWTHPPLGKIIIGIGIRMFGMTPFGWRLMGTIAGVIMIPVMYIFAKYLFGRTRYALLAALLMACDGMHFTQTRIATVDSFLVLFILLAYLYMYKYCHMEDEDPLSRRLGALALAGIWIGCAIATKWTGLYAGLGLAIIFFWNLYQRRRFDKQTVMILLSCVVFFVFVPIVIYCASYIPYFTANGSEMRNVTDFINMQKQMYNYHSKLTATHPYGSPWWSWPILYRPVWFYMGEGLPSGIISTIVMMGNPLIWWSGTIALVFGIYWLFKRKDQELLFLMIALLTAYVPYIGVNRIMFLYHFFPCLPFMIFFIIYAIREIERRTKSERYTIFYIVGVVALFGLFYPIYSGLEIPKSYAVLLRWLPSWCFFN